jgi:hypothetical protein
LCPSTPGCAQVAVPLVAVYNLVRGTRDELWNIYMEREAKLAEDKLPSSVKAAVHSRRKMSIMLMRPGAGVREAAALAAFATPLFKEGDDEGGGEVGRRGSATPSPASGTSFKCKIEIFLKLPVVSALRTRPEVPMRNHLRQSSSSYSV